MAAQTLSTSRNFDDAAISSWANGDTLTLDTNATLTFNSDNRWGQQSAVLGNITMSALLGGNLTIDGSTVWWIPFDASSGNVPALGTCGTPDVTRGGSNVGEFLGVWTALGVAPSAAGGAMPASGFIKLRQKSVTFADNDVLTFAGGATITINSATGGSRGWISHFCGNGSIITMSRQNTHTINGDWFELGTTNGTDGQTLQHYVADYCAGVEVETAPGSGVYEKYPTVYEGIATTQRMPIVVTACANNGSGLVRITSAAHGLSTGDQVIVAGVLGATGANGTFTVTVISTTQIDLQGSTFGGTWTSATGAFVYNGTSTYPGAVPITSITNSSGLVRVTTTHAHGINNSQTIKISGVSDSGEVNGSWTATVISTTVIDLTYSSYKATYGAGGALKLSAWNDRTVAPNKYNITGIADNGAGYLRVTTNAPTLNRISLPTGTMPTSVVAGANNIMQLNWSYSNAAQGGLVYIESITGTGAIPSVGYYANVAPNTSFFGLSGTTYSAGSTISALRMMTLNPCVAPGSWQTIGSMSAAPGTGYIRVTMYTTFSHGLNTGDPVCFKTILGSGSCLALNGTVTTATVVNDLVFDVPIVYSGGFTSGLMGDVKSFQTVAFSGITGTGSISGLNGNSYKAIMVGPNTFDLTVLTAGGTYTSGGVIDNGDQRGKFVLAGDSGAIKFGGPTTGWGFLPPSGCKVRVPNVHLSEAVPNAYAYNMPAPNPVPSSRARFTLAQGSVNWNGANVASFSSSFTTAYALSLVNVHSCDQTYISLTTTTFTITNSILNQISDIGHGAFNAVNNPAGGAITSTNIAHTNSVSYTAYSAEIQYCNNITIDGCNVSCGMNGQVAAFTLLDCANFTIKNSRWHSGFYATSCPGLRILNNSFSDKSSHHGNVVFSTYLISVANCIDVVIDGLSFGYGVQSPSQYIVQVSAASQNVRIRNIGTRTAPIDGKNVTANSIMLTGFPIRTVIARVYVNNFIQNYYPTSWSSSSDSVFYDYGHPGSRSYELFRFMGYTTSIHRMDFGYPTPAFGQSAGYFPTGYITTNGMHFFEYVLNDTTLACTLMFTEKSVNYPSNIAYTVDVGTPTFSGNGNFLPTKLNDQVTWTSDWIKGCDGFQNTAPLYSATNISNMTITYDLDKGAGFSGSFKTLTAANLYAETGVLPSGFRYRLRIACNSANINNAINGLAFYANTSATLMANNMYQLSNIYESFTGLVAGTTGNIFKVGDGSQCNDSTATTSLLLRCPWSADFSAVARIRLCGYAPIEVPMTITETDQAIPLTQTRWSDVPLTDPGALNIAVTNHGASPVTWNGKQFSITIQDNGGYTGAQILNYIHWNIAKNDQWNGFSGQAWPTMVLPNSTSYETSYGTLFGSAGSTLKGVRVVQSDGTTAHASFSRAQADDGSYYSAPVSATLTLSGLQNPSEVRIYRASDMVELAGQENVTSGSFGYTYVWGSDVPIYIAILSLNYQNLWLSTSLTSTGGTIPITQTIDRQYA